MEEIDKQEEKKEESKPKAEQPKRKPKATPKKKPKPLVHIDDFISLIRTRVNISVGQEYGFKTYMFGNHYMKSYDDFIPHLEKYINKKV